MKSKTIVIIISVLMVGAIIASCAAKHFTKTQETKEEITNETVSSGPTIIKADKEKFEKMSEHEFISAVTPVLESNFNSAIYTTFDFGDGTGIYFPFSDITKSASYANLDSEGFPTSVIGTITISGTHVSYEELTGSATPAAKEIEQYTDASYINDLYCATINNNNLYANIMMNVQTDLEAQADAIEYVRSLVNNGYNKDVDHYYVCVDRQYLCVVSKNVDSVELDQNLLDPALEILF